MLNILTMNAPTTGCCDGLYNAGATSVNWLKENSKAFAASAGETFSKVWAAVSEFFSSIMTTLGVWLNAAKEGLIAAKDQFTALPREAKIVGGLTLGVSILATWLLARCWNSGAPAQTNTPASVAQQTNTPASVAQQTNTPASVAQQQPAATQQQTSARVQ